MRAETLSDRGLLALEGPDAASFLHGIATNDVEGMVPGEARFAALLTPQGKILCDFLVARPDGSAAFLLDAPAERLAELKARLALYKLRAQLTIDDRSPERAVVWSGDDRPVGDGRWFADPRSAQAGRRAYPARAEAPSAGEAWEERRIALAIPKGGLDFVYGDAFPHEANMDRLNGLSFTKGCYVGQEVVSRMQHRGLVRNRIVKVRFSGRSPPPGAEIRAGDALVGRMGGSRDGIGLAMLRLDRLEAARASGIGLVCEGVALEAEP